MEILLTGFKYHFNVICCTYTYFSALRNVCNYCKYYFSFPYYVFIDVLLKIMG